MKQDCEVVCIICGVEFGNVEETAAAEAVGKVLGIKRWGAAHVQATLFAIDAIAVYVDGIDRESNGQDKEKGG